MCKTGGVFVTWRQKDREEPQLGLYGKNAFYYTKESEDNIFLIEEFNKNAPKSDLRQIDSKVRDSPKINKLNVSSKDKETMGKDLQTETSPTDNTGNTIYILCCVCVCVSCLFGCWGKNGGLKLYLRLKLFKSFFFFL